MKCYCIVNISLIILVGNSLSAFRDCNDCTQVFKTRQSIVTSPKYPENYPASTCCDYILRSPYRCSTNYHIQFLDFALEPSLNCANDFLAIGYVGNPEVDVRNYGAGDILCGRVTGIRKYRSHDGILRVRFVTNDVHEDRGFRLLITRLSCNETTASNITFYMANGKDTFTKSVVTLPSMELLPPFKEKPTKPDVSDLTKETNNYQAEQYLPPAERYLPNNPAHPFHPQSPTSLTPTNNWYLPPEHPCPTSPPQWIQGNTYYPQPNNYPKQLPAGSCCAENFRQQRFYLTSPGFPARIDTSPPRDCFFYMEKYSQNVCRLRVVFRFFALGSANADSGECLNDFIEIDGERMCGCRTGLVVTKEWGLGVKVIHLRTYGRQSGTTSIGFLLDVTQDDCGPRYSRQLGGNTKLIPHAIFETNSTTKAKFYLHEGGTEQLGYPSSGGVSSKLFFSQENPCEFSFADLLRISFDPFWVARPRC